MASSTCQLFLAASVGALLSFLFLQSGWSDLIDGQGVVDVEQFVSQEDLEAVWQRGNSDLILRFFFLLFQSTILISN
tara:strand:- start:282 stop:512 length:231 start_codon:yes stop_codon:yes gene_type:complete